MRNMKRKVDLAAVGRQLVVVGLVVGAFGVGTAALASADQGGLAVEPDYCDSPDHNPLPGECTVGDPLHNGYTVPRYLYDGFLPADIQPGEELDVFYSASRSWSSSQRDCAVIQGDYIDLEVGVHTFVNHRGEKVSRTGWLCHNINAPASPPDDGQPY